MKKLYPHQVEWNQTIRMLTSKYQRVLAQAPTGMGKTICITELVRCTRPGAITLIGLHRQELLFQTAAHLCEQAKLGKDGLPVMPTIYARNELRKECYSYVRRKGQEKGESWWLGKSGEVGVAMLPTLAARLKAGNPMPMRPTIFFIDEAHHAVAKTWARVIEHYAEHEDPKRRAIIIGMTATPERRDGVSLMRKEKPIKNDPGVFDTCHFGPTTKELVQNGFLARPRVFVPAQGQMNRAEMRLDGKTKDFRKDDAERAANTIIGDALANFKKNRGDNDLPFLAFCVSVKHAEAVAASFKAAGFRAASVDGKMSETERAGLIDALGRRELDLLSSCEVLGEGLDVPCVGGAILLRPTQSRTIHFQQIGRALRTSPGKPYADFYDHAGNTQALGDPMDDTIIWTPEGANKQLKAASPPCYIVCDECGFLNGYARTTCGQCGAVLPRGVGRVLTEEEGVLINTRQITPEEAAWSDIWLASGSGKKIDIPGIARSHGLGDEFINRVLESVAKRYEWNTSPLANSNERSDND